MPPAHIKKRNAVILAAGTASRFVPLSAECPKGLLEVRGEILIERQIRQLNDAGISDITVVVGYKAWMFEYLKNKFGVDIVINEDFYKYNNVSSLIRVLDRLENTYICSSDNYFLNNVFKESPLKSYYSALYSLGKTDEYCITTDSNDDIISVSVGGSASWYMVGHVYFSHDFSCEFKKLLSEEYLKEEIRHGYWEDVYIRHINHLPHMQIHCYPKHALYEFDSIDELRIFDSSYIDNTRSRIIRDISVQLACKESELSAFVPLPHSCGNHPSFSFQKGQAVYLYTEQGKIIERT